MGLVYDVGTWIELLELGERICFFSKDFETIPGDGVEELERTQWS